MFGAIKSKQSTGTGFVMGVLCALAATFKAGSGAVIRSPAPVWMNSCNTNGESSLPDVIDVEPDQTTATTEELRIVYQQLLDGARQAKQVVSTLEVEYRTARPVTDADYTPAEAAGWFELTGLPHITPLTQAAITHIDAVDEARTTFNELAHAAVFLEQIVLDVAEYEPQAVVAKFNNIRAHNLAMLCHLTKVLAHHQTQISQDVASDVMTQTWQSPESHALRQMRDIITLRYMHTSLEKTQTAFRHLKRQLPGS